MKQSDQLMQPFFAQFLEAQKRTQETAGENYIGIEPVFTTKPFVDMEHSLKYPSDGDET